MCGMSVLVGGFSEQKGSVLAEGCLLARGFTHGLYVKMVWNSQNYGMTTWDGLTLLPKLWNGNLGWVQTYGMTTWDGLPLNENSCFVEGVFLQG
eukprot:4657996-Amphidinium_carterae.1